MIFKAQQSEIKTILGETFHCIFNFSLVYSVNKHNSLVVIYLHVLNK